MLKPTKVRWRFKGEAYMVRYAAAAIFCFQYENEAKWFYEAMIERMGQYNLEIAQAQEKAKIIPFGRKAYADAKRKGRNRKHLTFWGLRTIVAKAKVNPLDDTHIR
jgi:RNA-directed DNA polymerase